MKKKMIYRSCIIGYILLVLVATLPFSAFAASDVNYGSSYFSYTYDYQGRPVATPAAYEIEQTVSGYAYGDKPFADLTDITYNGKGQVYLADSGNNRVLICDETFKLVSVLDTYTLQGKETTFNLPTCVAIANGNIYVADSQNARIVVFDEKTLATKQVLEKPVIAALGEKYTYIPTKIAVDFAGRIYVIAKNINKGLIQLDQDGNFENFLGAPKVVPKMSEMILRKILSRSMRDKLIQSVPTEYNAVNIDQDGFLFVTSQSSNIPPIAKLNGQGTNVLTAAYDQPSGDGNYTDVDGKRTSSMFMDIIPRKDGGYFALDSQRGRVFSYDRQGMLLYIFGSLGTSQGSFYSATAMEYIDEKIAVADKSMGTISIFRLTEFGSAVDTAVGLSAEGKMKEEKPAWENVLRLCSNYDIAEINLAKIEMDNGAYTSAMDRLSAIEEKENYGIAYNYARTQWFKDNFYWLAAGLAVLVILIILWFKVGKKSQLAQKIRSNSYYREVKYSTHVILHPFDGFWDLKRERRGSMRGALTILALFVFWYGIRAKFTGYLFMSVPSKEVNILMSVSTILIPVLLWAVSNWCFTTLMDGKGTMKDTFIAVCYALTPYVLVSPLQFVLSFVLVNEEMAFYTYIDVIVLAWVLALLFFGMMMTHDYSFSKSLLTALLTIIGICLILFICLLLFNLFNEVYTYFYDIYKEVTFRFY